MLWEHIPSGTGIHSQWYWNSQCCGNTFPVALELPVLQEDIPSAVGYIPSQQEGHRAVIHPQAARHSPAMLRNPREGHVPLLELCFSGIWASRASVCTPGVKSDLQKTRAWLVGGEAAPEQLQLWCSGVCASKTSTGAGLGLSGDTQSRECSARTEGKARPVPEAELSQGILPFPTPNPSSSSEAAPCSSQGVLLTGVTQK